MNGSIRQRSPGSWELQVFLGRDTQGKRLRKTETVRGKKNDAQRRLREMLANLDHGIAPPQRRYKLRDWLDLWMNDVIIPNRRQKTIDRYKGIIGLHIVPYLGNVEIAKLTPVQVQGLESTLQRDKGMAPMGIQLVHGVLSGAMRHALKMELVSRNPVAAVSPPTVVNEEVTSPDVPDVRRLLSAAEAEGHYYWPCLHLIAYTGMRRGEALGLKWAQVELDNHQLLINASLVITTQGLALEPPKTASGQRVVDLDSCTVEMLRKHRVRQVELAKQLGGKPPEKVFPREGTDEWCHPNTLSHALISLAKRTGCPGITLRSLRHFHATLTLHSGQNIVVVSKRLGHANVSITSDIYAHVLPGWQREAAEAFAQAMSSSD